MSNADDPFWDVALRELKKVDERLWMEVSDPCSAQREFIVTAYAPGKEYRVSPLRQRMKPFGFGRDD